MATVVITFFLITQFYVCKMDADYRERRRNISQREKRWSMNSQRLEEIVAELMKPISDVRRSFDTDLSALLEEYLTEAGLHALDAEEGEGNATIPNFAELALLLQQSASIYSRKVDFLYQHVLNVSKSLHNSTQEAAAGTSAEGGAESGAAPSPSRRKRKASQHEEFSLLALEPCAAARREPAQPRPPPTLPRMYVELEPRVLAACDAPLRDYCGEPIGLLGDFHVTWRLQDGLLVEELAGGGISESSLRALPLTELQAAIEAAAPPSPPPCFTPPSSPLPPASSTPLPASRPASPAAPAAPAASPPPDKRERKRRSDGDVEPLDGTVKLLMNKKLRRRLQREEEFSVPERWVRRVVRARAAAVLAARRALAAPPAPGTPPAPDFRGFDISDSIDVGGFRGWSSSEAGAALGAAEAAAARRPDDSDDDGFFEQSSLGDSDTSRADEPPGATALAALPGAAEWGAWRERVLARAAAAEARGADVQRSAGALLAAAQALPPACAFPALLARTAADQADVSKLFLATLFLANAGNVEIIQGPPLTLNTFSVRLVSTDERLYRTAAAADEQFLR